ncbi:glycosyltransferase family 2 protein [Salinimicrobium tongyeongense]|uniref:Glycosyltransferase family 2 protein n=1 Tax=Salinimicrobium tongyeongense TaxID=2809707 RepID=A0ABY6NRV2_9FLAO|nr:glycosyltransferase family 2 protein [Salinimicrobium tongyeongense]UZH55639.1 glycosyltransferase family 2 protein [Salinimicrobium tongyeongense]
MKIGGIVVTYNGMEWIKGCLTSLSQSECDLEIVVVDNSSEDNTVAFILSNFPDVVLLQSKTNIGFGQANNIGLSYGIKNKWDYAFLLNQDAEVYPETIEGLVEVAKKNKDYGIISPVHLNASGQQLDPSFLYYLNRNSNNGMTSDLLLQKPLAEIYDFNMVNAAAWLLPARTLRTVGGFSPIFFLYGEDDNYCQRVLYHNLKIGVVPSVFICHDSGNNNTIPLEKGSEKYLEKFLNQKKVRFGNVNTEEYKNLDSLKMALLKNAVKSFISLRFNDFRIYLQKRRMIRNLNFRSLIENDRKPGANYLDF